MHAFRDCVADARARRADRLAQFDKDRVRVQFGVVLQIAHIAQPFARAKRRREAGRWIAARVIADPGHEGKCGGEHGKWGEGGGGCRVEGGNGNKALNFTH